MSILELNEEHVCKTLNKYLKLLKISTDHFFDDLVHYQGEIKWAI